MEPRRDDPELLARLLDRAPAIVILVDALTTIRWVNRAAEELFGFTVEELIGRSIVEFLDPDWDPEAFESIATAMGGSGRRPPMLFRAIGADGSKVIVEVTADAQMDDPVLAGMVVYARRWDERYLLDQALEAMAASRPLEETLRLLVAVAEADTLDAAAAILHDRDGPQFSDAVVSDGLTPVLAGPTAGQPTEVLEVWAPLIAGPGAVHAVDDLPAVLRKPAEAAGLRTLWVWSSEARGDLPSQVTVVAWRREDHLDVDQTRRQAMARLARIAGLVVERVRSEEATVYAATHDALTGLANRARLFAVLNERLAASGEGDRLGVIYLDLDGFKPINDRYGHAAGDAVLVEVARRVTGELPDASFAARIGGDEFVVVCRCDVRGELRALADGIVARISESFEIDSGAAVRIGVSAGVAEARPEMSADSLLEAADAALYMAKRDGGGIVRVGGPRDRG